MTEDGRPYGPIMYNKLIEECYSISKYLHTSYEDVKLMTPTERQSLIKFLIRDAEKENEMWDKMRTQK